MKEEQRLRWELKGDKRKKYKDLRWALVSLASKGKSETRNVYKFVGAIAFLHCGYVTTIKRRNCIKLSATKWGAVISF
jgi:hypothetical protein